VISGFRERRQLMTPRVRQFRKAVNQDDWRPASEFVHRELYLAGIHDSGVRKVG
jgi:hypothetical protein